MSATGQVLLPAEPPAPPAQGLHPVSVALPNIWLGYAIAGICIVLETELEFFQPGNDRIEVLHALVGLSGLPYWILCIYRIHKILAEATDHAYPISPRRALWLQAIPIFSLIWNFKMVREFSNFIRRTDPSVRAAVYWPPVLILLSSLLPMDFMGVKLFAWFGVAHYLSSKAQRVITFNIKHLSRKQPLDLAISAGLGAGFGFVLIQAIVKFTIDKHIWHEVVALLLVCVAAAKFLEPMFDHLREWLGVAEEHHGPHRPKNLKFKIMVIVLLVFTSMMHGLLHEHIVQNLPQTGLVLFLGLLVSGGTTYCWSLGAHKGRAAKHGFYGGLAIAAFAVCGIVLSPPLLAKLSSNVLTMRPQVAVESESDKPWKAQLTPSDPCVPSTPVAQQSNQGNDNIDLLLIIFAPAIFGLVGGLAIDKSQRARAAIKTGVGLLLAAAVTALVINILLPLFQDQSLARVTSPMRELSFALFWFVMGWWLGLYLHPSSDHMLCIGAPQPTDDAHATTSGSAI